MLYNVVLAFVLQPTESDSVVVQSLSHVRLFVTHGLQHARLLRPSLSPGGRSNSCSLSQQC